MERDLDRPAGTPSGIAANIAVERVKVAANDNRPSEHGRFSLDWFSSIEDEMPKETFVKGVFGVGEFTMISGQPGAGKSVITTDAACHVAAGMDWHGRQTKHGLVVYVAAERKDLTKRRILAFLKRYDVKDAALLVIGGRLDMTAGKEDVAELVLTIQNAERECGHKCVWIIIDTLTRVFGAGDQNASKDMSRFVQTCDLVREKVEGSHLTVIHHTGWAGDRGKGAIDLDGAVDASFLVEKKAGGYVFECDGANDADEGIVTQFRMEGVQVGTSEDGEPTMAPVVVPAEALSAGERLVANVKGHTAKALECLIGLSVDGSPVGEALWREAFYAAYDGTAKHTLKVRFQRARTALIDEGLIDGRGGTFWPVEGGTNGTCADDVPCAAS